MREELKKLCEEYITNWDEIKKAFKSESHHILPICANYFLTKKKNADYTVIEQCKGIVKSNTKIMGTFRGSAFAPTACMLSCSDEPEKMMDDSVKNFDILKKALFSSEYLALVSVVISDMYKGLDLSEKTDRIKEIYANIVGNTVIGDEIACVFSILSSFSEKSEEGLINDFRESTKILKGFSSKEYVRYVAQILSNDDRTPEEKCGRFMSLFEKLRESGIKYGKTYELTVLAFTVLNEENIDTLAEEIKEVDEFLKSQKNYKGLLGYDKVERYMHAALIVSSYNSSSQDGNLIVVSSAISIAISVMLAFLIFCI